MATAGEVLKPSERSGRDLISLRPLPPRRPGKSRALTRQAHRDDPGIVGMQACTHDDPEYHIMETGSPDARHAVMEKNGRNWLAQLISVPYETRLVVGCEDPDAFALATGYFTWTATTRPTARRLRSVSPRTRGSAIRYVRPRAAMLLLHTSPVRAPTLPTMSASLGRRTQTSTVAGCQGRGCPLGSTFRFASPDAHRRADIQGLTLRDTRSKRNLNACGPCWLGRRSFIDQAISKPNVAGRSS